MVDPGCFYFQNHHQHLIVLSVFRKTHTQVAQHVQLWLLLCCGVGKESWKNTCPLTAGGFGLFR